MSLAAEEKGRFLLSLHVFRMLTGEQSLCALRTFQHDTQADPDAIRAQLVHPSHCLSMLWVFPQR